MNESTSTTEAFKQPIDRVSAAAVAYLLVPNLIFLSAWFRWYVAIPAILLLLWAAQRCCDWRAAMNKAVPLPPGVVLLLAAAGMAWAAFGGAGHFLYANPDWPTRDTVLGDLVRDAWPLGYELADGTVVLLRTAMGYYLPAAAFAKVFGLGMADIALYAWTAAGTILFLLLLPWRFVRGSTLVAQVAVIVLFSGMDIIGVQATASGFSPFAYPHHIEWWAGDYQFSSHATQLFWVPNHALPAWIATALLLRHRTSGDQVSLLVFVLPLLLLWSPFAAIGVLPFVVYEAALRLMQKRLRIPPAVILGVLPLAYLTVRLMTLQLDALPVTHGLKTAPHDPELQGAAYRALLLPLFLLLEALLLALALSQKLARSRDMLLLCCVVLIVLPLVRFGPYNDIVMRASIPALAVLAILTLAVINGNGVTGSRPSRPVVVWMLLAIGSVTPLYEFWRAVALTPWPADYSQTLMQRHGRPPNYVADFDNRNIGWLLRPVLPVPSQR